MQILAPVAPEVKQEVTFVAPSPRLCWAAGFDAYIAGRPYEEMVDVHMRKGWIAALSAEAECNTPGYAQKMGW